MNALTVPPVLICALATLSASVQDTSTGSLEHVKIDLKDSVHIPDQNHDENKVMSFEIKTHSDEETGRGKQKKLMQKILPLFLMPFLLQSTIVPLFLGMLKFMLFKSLMIGKLALVLIIINAFKSSNSFKGRQDEDIANIHYGYHGNGMEEYGSYFNS